MLSKLDNQEKPLDWKKLTEVGFEEIDPNGLFTGKYPKLGGNNE